MENNLSNRRLFGRIALRLILAVACGLFVIFVIPRAIRILWPFVIAFIVAAIINPVTTKINRRFGVSRKVVAVVLDLLVFLIVSSLLGLLVYSVVTDIVTLATGIQQNWDGIMEALSRLEGKLSGLTRLLPPAVTEWLSGFEGSIITTLQNASKSLLNSIVAVTGTVTAKTGSFFVNFIMYILAAYFIIADYNRITALFKRAVGNRFGKYLAVLKSSAVKALGGYAKSQLLLALFAFVFMLVALVIYRQPYALLIALFLGFIDLLPIVGTIAVLAPWGVVTLLAGDVNKGIFLIALGVAFLIIRKFVEPKIVGSQTGLHPLAALAGTYVGLQFSGVWGAVLGPVALMLIIGIAKSGIFDNTVADLKDAADSISAALGRPDKAAETDTQA